MRLKQLKLKNFAQFENFELVFNDDITKLIGMNGDGKTTVGLTAIWAGFKGIAEKSTTGALIGQRYRFITEGKKSLDIQITLHDEKTDMDVTLTRHITKTTNTIKIDSSSLHEPLTKEYIENLFNVAFLSASHFSALTGKEQAAAMGIDTASFDKDLKAEKEKAAGYRRDIKKIGELTPVAKCEKKNIKALQLQHKAAMEHNATQTKLTAHLSTLNDDVETNNINIHDEIEAFERLTKEHEDTLKRFHETRDRNRAAIITFPIIEPPTPLEPIDKAIADIVELNEKYFKYEIYQNSVTEKEEAEGYLSESLERQADINTERGTYLQSKSFGIKGLQIDEAGNLTKDGKLIRMPYFSKGELEMLVARIAMNLNPELRVRFIDDFELLDDVNQEKLIKNLTKKGFQIITGTVGNKKTDNKSVLLRACKVDPADNAVGINGAGDWDEEEPTIYSNSDDPDNCEDRTPSDVDSRVKIKDLKKTVFEDPDDFDDMGDPIIKDVIAAKEVCKAEGVTTPEHVEVPAPEASNTTDDFEDDNPDDDF